MAKRVVVQLQMKTIKRYSFPGFLSVLFLAFFVALPIVEMFMPLNSFINTGLAGGTVIKFTALDVIKSVFKSDNGILMQMFTGGAPSYSGQAQAFYQTFCQVMPILMIVLMGVFFLQCALAVWAFILIIIFLIRGRWAHFKAPFVFSHFGFWSSFFVLAICNGMIIFSTAMNLGGYREISNGYLVFAFPGWLYSIIYCGIGVVGFLGIFFAYEYGLADRIYIGKNRRKNEPDVTFFDKNNYNNIPEPSNDEPEVVEDQIESVPETKEESKDTLVGTTVPPVVPQIEPEPKKGIPHDIAAIGGHAFAENQNVIIADIPVHIDKLGDAAFSNCLNLTTVKLHRGVKSIGSNCFFNCARLTRINFEGTKAEWKSIKRGSNWLLKAGTKVINCSDGPVQVNPYH